MGTELLFTHFKDDAFVKSRHPGPHIREDKLQPGSRKYLTY